MCLLIETIKLQNGILHNIELHNKRAINSRKELFGLQDDFNLQNLIEIPEQYKNSEQIIKCRVVYGENIEKVEFINYKPKPVQTLKIVHADNLDYSHKYLNRTSINNLLATVNTDDILIVKSGFITDISFANIAFYNGRWVTPKTAILYGTKRNLLVSQNLIFEEELTIKDLSKFQYATIINSMLDIGDTSFISIKNIFL